ncbi:uncharacterized protein [Pseudorasbora parva]|uniref:uncharacterized protein n=1 Tax=Pseudorasbora parva TaxID=51549 RepID=UPI00351EB2B5
MAIIKDESEDMMIEETFSVKQVDTETQIKMVFIEETEDVRIEETLRVKDEDTETQIKMVFIKEGIEETFSVKQEDPEEQTKMAFIEETEDVRIEETFRVKHEDPETQTKMVLIKVGSEDLRIEETFSVKQEDPEEQTAVAFIEETEDVRIEETFRVKHEDPETQTKMVLIKVGSEDLRIEETFSVKQEDPEEQTKVAFIKESEDMRIKETFSVMQENTETQINMVCIKETSEDMRIQEKSRVKQDDTGIQTDCPLCLRGYHQLSQHLRLTHKVINRQERKLLLAISSGRVDVRKSTCPVPACGKSSSRIDRHLKDHTELTRAAQQETMKALKRKKIIDNLADLRASNPAVPMASTLDLEEAQDLMDEPRPLEEKEEEGTCDNPRCQQAHKQLQDQVVNLNRQVDMLSRSLRYVTRRYQLLRRRSRSKKLEEEDGKLHVGPSGELASQGPQDQPPTHQLEEHPFPDHVTALNVLLEEYRGQQEGANPTPKLKNKIGLKVLRIRHFIAYMAVGRSDLASLTFLNQPIRMRSWFNSLTQAIISKPTIHHYLKNVAQFLDYMAETPPPTCHLSKVVLVGIRRQAKIMLKLLQRKVVVQKVAFNPAKEGRLIPKAVLKECRSTAKQRIPEILARLRNSGDKKDQWSFYGHLTAYLACIYGHRSGVFQNMTIKEVEEAQHTTTEGNYVINISSHMTNQAFGAAQLFLDAEEYEWLQDFLSMRSTLVGGNNAYYFFFTSKPSSSKNLNQYFQEAWAGMGLPGTPTFTDVRTSIATHAKNTHSPENWYKVVQFMCQDTSTADRFYVLNLNAKQAAEHRHLFESAVEGEKTTVLKKVETWRPPTKRAASPSPSATPPQTKEGLLSKESASEEPSPAKRQLFSLKKINLTPINSELPQEERDKVLKIVVTRLPGVFRDIMDYR